MRETDLPCSECGTDLAEMTVQTDDIPVSTDWRGSVTVAECRGCGARHYPKRTIERLTTDPGAAEQGGHRNSGR